MPTKEEIMEENHKINRLRLIVDSTAFKLRRNIYTKDEALRLIEDTKEKVLELFPDKGELFEIIYRPRFMKIIEALKP